MAQKMMSSRERVLAALNHQEPDRIPRDFGGTFTTSIHVAAQERLKHFLGLEGGPDDIINFQNQTAAADPRIMQRFGSDCAPLMTKPPSTWKLRILTDSNGYRKFVDEWGVVRACPTDGYYYDVVSSPLATIEMKDLDRFEWPDPADPGRFDGLISRAEDLFEGTDKCVVLSTGTSLFNHVAALMGWENFLISLAERKSLVKAIIEHLVDYNQALITSALEQAGKYIHVFNLAGDLTHQQNLFVNKNTVHEIFMPAYQKLITTAKTKADVKVLFHICGASRLLFEELVSAGVDAVNPVQVAAWGMDDTAELKREFGDQLTFWGGGCDTQHVLPYGTTDDVRREVRRRVVDLAPGGGFVFCPVHNIQTEVPPENIVAIYDELSQWDTYPIRVGELR